ncbi:MAG: HipA domain-containing protein [Thermoleophilia bacterium]|nr:HipA domain-containing protein [Thermoleophilia bacterium]
MAPRTKRLGVWLEGLRVADLEQRRRGEIRCRYSDASLERWQGNSPLLSCSLPLDSRPLDALAFCKGLLPEGQALQTMAAAAGVAVNDTFELLAHYGRDVAGALVIGEEEPAARRFGVEPYTEEALATAVAEVDEYPLGAHDDSELSLAGLQDKLLLVELEDGSWGRPVGGRPSTHILKVDDPRHPGLVDAEALCLELARAAGLTTIESRLLRFGETQCLLVSRFDRLAEGEEVLRIHQEDLCQATGVDPEDKRGRAKYERAGGPSLRQAAALLDAYAVDPGDQLDRLAAVVTFTVLIGNADAHGKNLALLHPTPENVSLAPLYDTVPTALWSNLRTEAAMAIGGQVSLPDAAVNDIVREGGAWSLAEDRTRAVAISTVEAVVDAIDREVIPPRSELAAFVRERAAQLLG